MQTQTKTRIEQHREDFESRKYCGNLIRIEELSTEEIMLINASLFNEMRLSESETLDDYYQIYIKTLHSWGIMCPHPQYKRLYYGNIKSEYPINFEHSKWYDCLLCGTSVINR